MSKAKPQEKVIAAALSRLEKLKRISAFEPSDLNSRPTATQAQIIEDFGKVRQQYIRAGSQCLAKDTLVATPSGPRRIQDISVGDEVYSELGTPIRVLRTFSTGIKTVYDLTNRGVNWVSATPEHVFQVITPYNHIEEKKVSELGRDDKIRRVHISAPLGTKHIAEAYVLGALLGDGCSREDVRSVRLSSGIQDVPSHCASIIGNTARKLHEANYTWDIGYADIPFYNEWCRGRYAHEKIIDLEEIKTWDRNSLLNLVAGLLDTDGTVYIDKNNELSLSLNMQAKPVVDAFHYAVLALWQVNLNYTIDNRPKYKNGPVHSVYTRSNTTIRHIMKELDQYIVSPQKKWREEYNTICSMDRSTLDSIGMSKIYNTREVETYDIHVDSNTNLYLLANGLVTHNSGKSSTSARLVTWFLTDTHPNWKRPERWGTEPLLCIVAGRTGKQIEESLLPRITRLLEPGTYKEVRIGNIIQRLEMTNGNRIIFQSLENPTMARERLQSYTAHLAWVDELPPTLDILLELLRSIQARDGQLIASFTPLTPNLDVQKYIDNIQEPIGRVYRFNMLDNPLYADPVRRQEILDSLAAVPENVRNARLYGDWLSANDRVYNLNYNQIISTRKDLEGYNPFTWRHMEVVDPALSSACGVLIAVEHPVTTKWHILRTEYLRGVKNPVELIESVKRISSKYNVIRRVCDPAANWYITQAAAMGISYIGVYNKNGVDRKQELIANLQKSLGTRILLQEGVCQDLLQELQDCRYSPETGKIVNSQSFHLLDCAQYLVDTLPSPSVGLGDPIYGIRASSWEDWLYKANDLRKTQESKKKRQQQVQRSSSTVWRSSTSHKIWKR